MVTPLRLGLLDSLAAGRRTSIDEIRDDYGEAESNPAIQISRPVGSWPMIIIGSRKVSL